MLRRAIDLLLIAAIAVGGFAAWQSGRERMRLQSTYQRLSGRAGDLVISDPSKIHILALPTGEPLHLAWRIYMPAKANLSIGSRTGSSQTMGQADAQQFLARVRIREDGQGGLDLYESFWGGSSRSGLGDRELADLLRGHWGELEVEQLGAPQMVAIDPKATATLLRLKLPPGLQKEAEAKFDQWKKDRLVPVLFELTLNPNPSNP